MIAIHEIDCPVCLCTVLKQHIKPGVEQRYENVMCRNGHSFTIDIGYARCHVFNAGVRHKPEEQRADTKRYVIAQLQADAIQREVVDWVHDRMAAPHVYGEEIDFELLAYHFENVVSSIRKGATS